MEVNKNVNWSKIVYPAVKREENIVDDYHGHRVIYKLYWQVVQKQQQAIRKHLR